MGILKNSDIQNFDKYLYQALPQVYRVMDLEEGELTFARLLDAMNQGGFVHTNNQIVQVLEMSQIDNCPENYLSIFAHSLGCDWIEDMPLQYRRKFLNLIVRLYQSKGSRTSIEYLARELSGFEVDIIENDIPDEYWQEGDEKKRLFTIKLLAPEVDDPIQSKESEVTITKIIGRFVPVHSKYIVLVSYFYDEPHRLKCSYTDTTNIVQDVGTNNKEVKTNINTTQSDKVVITYVVEEEKTKDLGLDTYVMCTNVVRCKTSSKEGRLTNPSYIDKVKIGDTTEHIYY